MIKTIRALPGSLTRLSLTAMIGFLVTAFSLVFLITLLSLVTIALLGMGAAGVLEQVWSPINRVVRLLVSLVGRKNGAPKA